MAHNQVHSVCSACVPHVYYRSVMTFNLFSRLYLHCSTKRLLEQLPEQYLALPLPFDTFRYFRYACHFLLCHFVCTYCKYIALLYYLLTLGFIDYKFICVEHSMDFKLGCFDHKLSLGITKHFIAVIFVPAYNSTLVHMY